jgi:TonB family protein
MDQPVLDQKNSLEFSYCDLGIAGIPHEVGMKPAVLTLSTVLMLAVSAYSQSGRKAKEVKPPPPVLQEQPNQNLEKSQKQDEPPPVTAERNQDYRCTDDNSLARILDPVDEREHILSAKDVDTRAVINEKPKPSYTREARRNGVQGLVILKVVLSATGRINRVRVVRRVPFGLTENAIKVACKIDFKPAIKEGQPVSQWVQVEYAFRLADSSIFGP